MVKKNNTNILTLKKLNSDKKVFSSVVKTCNKKISSCVKLLFANKFNQRKIMNKWGMEFIEIPKGEFFMGYNGNDALAIEKNNYKKVRIDNNFFIAKTEVTQRFYKAITGKNPSKYKCEDCPVENVSFNDIISFIEKLNKVDDKFKYRLPTEAEWEYVARNGKKTVFFWGNSSASLDMYAWHGGNSGGKPHKVATKKSDYWGVFDMNGNVYEMTSSFEKVKYFDTKALKYKFKNMIIAKGGCFKSETENSIRSTSHIRIKSNDKGASVLGFRLIIEKK